MWMGENHFSEAGEVIAQGIFLVLTCGIQYVALPVRLFSLTGGYLSPTSRVFTSAKL